MAHNPEIHPFEAIYFPGEGWTVLCPWVQTPEGHWWRPHVFVTRYGADAEELAKHYARKLNEWRDTNAALAAAQFAAAKPLRGSIGQPEDAG